MWCCAAYLVLAALRGYRVTLRVCLAAALLPALLPGPALPRAGEAEGGVGQAAGLALAAS